MSERSDPTTDLEARLRAYYERTLADERALVNGESPLGGPGRAPLIEGFRRLAAGWECEVFAFDLVSGDARLPEAAGSGAQPLVLRLYVGPEARPKADREYGIMRFLQGVGYPVPRVHRLELDPTPLGRPFVVMGRVDGQRFSQALHGSPYPRRRELVTRFCQLLVDLHAIDWRPLAPDLDAAGERGLLSSFLDQMEGIGASHGLPELRPTLAWLRGHATDVGATRPAIVHLDYHMENLLIRPDDSIAVLDWTQGQVQDFRVDLGWMLLLTGMYDGWAMREALLGEYRRLAPWPVEAVEYFEVLAAARRLFSMLIILGGQGSSLGLDPRAAEQIQANLGHLAAVYALFLGRTGISVPSAERALAHWDGGR